MNDYYDNEIEQAIEEVGVPDGMTAEDWTYLIHSVIQTESNYNPNTRSSAGAIGLMQLLPGTAEDMGVNRVYLTDPYSNILAGTRYLKLQIENYGVVDGLAAYNGGPGNRNLPVTQQYASKVLAQLQTDLVLLQGEAGNALDSQLIDLPYKPPAEVFTPAFEVKQAGLDVISLFLLGSLFFFTKGMLP